MKTTRRAFTLVELLVALAVVALLAALLFPALASAREQGWKAACVSNLHQLYIAVALYAADNDRYLPPYDAAVGGGNVGPNMQWHPAADQSASLIACLRPYTHSSDIWFCPSDVFAHTASTNSHVRHQFLSYSYEKPLLSYYSSAPRQIDATVYRTAPPAQVWEPSQQRLFTDSSRWYRDADHPVPFYSHNGLFNTVYLDGHVKSLP